MVIGRLGQPCAAAGAEGMIDASTDAAAIPTKVRHLIMAGSRYGVAVAVGARRNLSLGA
jgi:hypothetical protein